MIFKHVLEGSGQIHQIEQFREGIKIQLFFSWRLLDRNRAGQKVAADKDIHLISLEEAKARMGGEIRGGYAFFVEDAKGEMVDKAVFRKGKRL